jgi:leucyl-tRNA synthetase
MAEELWERLGHADGVVAAGWPVADEAAAMADEVEIPIQVNGKVRARVTLSADADDDQMKAAALALPQVQAHLSGMEVVKVVVANRKLVSVVVRPAKAVV